jgi:hypothetical protein
VDVSFEAVFLLAYANLLLLAALGLHRLGRVNPSPWRSRALAGHRRRHPEVASAELPAALGAAANGWPPTWPHAEQPRLHSGIALVAATAALVLTIAGACRHHQPLELALLTLTGAAACAVLVRLVRALTRGGRPTQRYTGR